jgi:glycosyltransferase involved in cell wall biosynthesis
MSAGVPVLASAAGGLPEIVRDGETGLLTSNQPEIVAMRMRRLYEDKPLAESLGKAGREMVAARFSIDAMVAATEQVYLECLS